MLRPGQCLMVAVLEQAVADLESRSFNIRRKARAWFLARSARATQLFAFSRICHEFGCDPAVLCGRIFSSVASNTGQLRSRAFWTPAAQLRPPPCLMPPVPGDGGADNGSTPPGD